MLTSAVDLGPVTDLAVEPLVVGCVVHAPRISRRKVGRRGKTPSHRLPVCHGRPFVVVLGYLYDLYREHSMPTSSCEEKGVVVARPPEPEDQPPPGPENKGPPRFSRRGKVAPRPRTFGQSLLRGTSRARPFARSRPRPASLTVLRRRHDVVPPRSRFTSFLLSCFIPRRGESHMASEASHAVPTSISVLGSFLVLFGLYSRRIKEYYLRAVLLPANP